MAKFIEKVVDDLILNQVDFKKTTLVLPGNRPQLFFRKAFQKKCKNSILPKMVSIDDFIKEIAQVQSISQIQLWFEAYNIYRKFPDRKESFENFVKWIPTLLKDFDDIQTSLVDDQLIFEYLVSAERIKKWGNENLEIGSDELMSKHLNFWKMAYQLYLKLNEKLAQKGLGYKGLIYKKAVHNLGDFIQNNQETIVFVGLNALSNAEHKIVFELYKANQAKLYWDADLYYIEDENQESGHFLRKFKRELKEDFNWVEDAFSKPKNIQVIEIGKRVGQAQYLHQILSKIPTEELSQTALVLAEETLLPAVLSSIPAEVSDVNITMGFPLDKSSMAYFFRSLFELHMNRESLGKGSSYYFKNVLDILENPIFVDSHSQAKRLSQRIRQENRIFNSPEFLQNELSKSIYLSIFQSFKEPKSFVQFLMNWMEELMRNSSIQISELDKEYLYRFSLLFNQLYDELKSFQWIENFKTLYVLYNKLLQNETISFVGEPLAGLQIVGLLETRLLDFKNIIITSVNEGVLPPGRLDNSFIPYDIRREMGLNTYSENDSIFAYHFYRLLQRAENIQLLYNSENDALNSGERSRFIAQMEFESPHEIQLKVAAPKFIAVSTQNLEIQKSNKVLELLHNWAEKGISASSLSTYLRNPIDFYQNYILNLSEAKDAEENVDARVLGNIVHKSLEQLYKPILGKILNENDLKGIFSNIEKTLILSFSEEYGEGDFRRGKNFLVYQIAKKIIENVIEADLYLAKSQELTIHHLESNLRTHFELSNGQKVNLVGYIDRIDSINEVRRIIDYKTGSVDERSLNMKIDQLDKVFSDSKFAKSLQLLFYAYLYFGNENYSPVSFGIYPLKKPQKGIHLLKVDDKNSFDQTILNPFNDFLSDLILEILNPEIPFIYKEIPTW